MGPRMAWKLRRFWCIELGRWRQDLDRLEGTIFSIAKQA